MNVSVGMFFVKGKFFGNQKPGKTTPFSCVFFSEKKSLFSMGAGRNLRGELFP